MACLLREGLGLGFLLLLKHVVGWEHFVGLGHIGIWRLDVKPAGGVPGNFVLFCFLLPASPSEGRETFGAELFLGEGEDCSLGKPRQSAAASLEESKCEVCKRTSEL